MRDRSLGISFSLVLLSVAMAFPGSQETDGRGSFVKSFVEALNGRDPGTQKELLHPGSLGCTDAPAVSFFDEMFSPRIRPPVPEHYKWDITQVAPGTLPPFADKFDYRVLPTHLLQVDFESTPNNSTTFVVQLAREGDRWYVVAACPKPETKVAAEAARQARVKRAVRVRDLAAGIKPQLRETVLRLVREGRKIDAIMEYQKASGEALATAKEVVELLTSQSR